MDLKKGRGGAITRSAPILRHGGGGDEERAYQAEQRTQIYIMANREKGRMIERALLVVSDKTAYGKLRASLIRFSILRARRLEAHFQSA